MYPHIPPKKVCLSAMLSTRSEFLPSIPSNRLGKRHIGLIGKFNNCRHISTSKQVKLGLEMRFSNTVLERAVFSETKSSCKSRLNIATSWVFATGRMTIITSWLLISDVPNPHTSFPRVRQHWRRHLVLQSFQVAFPS